MNLLFPLIAVLIWSVNTIVSKLSADAIDPAAISFYRWLLAQRPGNGEVMMLAASTSYALYGVLTKRWAIPLPTWQSLYVQIFFGVMLLLPGFLLAPEVALTQQNQPLVLFAGLFASIVAPFLWILGVQRLGASTTSIFMNVVPVFTALIAVLFLHEQLHSYHWIGGGITLTGVMLAQRLKTPLRRTAIRES